jgi:succinate dehydrogenase / fumarate reductase iron-sulfur subunit
MTTFTIKRFHPESDEAPRWQNYTVETDASTTILQSLNRIRETQDATLSWRSSCRMGVCGSCMMIVNGKPTFACNTLVHDVDEEAIRLEPLWNFEVVKDLVADIGPALDHHASLKPYIIRDDEKAVFAEDRELEQSSEEHLEFMQFSYCMKCCACVAACPTVAMSETFPGPMPLAAAYRYSADSRDDGYEQRKALLEEHDSLPHCHYAGECSRVCPRGVDPGKAIQYLKRELVKDMFRKRKHTPAKLVEADLTPPDDIAEDLVPPGFTLRSGSD